MNICDTQLVSGTCTGHLGKFPDCHAEALYEITLDGTGEGCGDIDFEGYASKVEIEKSYEYSMDDGQMVVRMEPGFYIVWTSTTGIVTVGRYYDRAVWDRDFDRHAVRYFGWERGCNPSDPAGHIGCGDFDECQVSW